MSRMTLLGSATGLEEVGDPADRLLEDVEVGQRDQPEVVGTWPVEAGPVRDQDLLGAEQVDDEGLVVLDRVDLRIEPREAVERAAGLDVGDPWDLVQQPAGGLALLVEASTWDDQLLD